MRKHCLIALIGVILLAAHPAVPALRAQAPTQQEVLAVVHRLFDGMRKGDSGMIRSAFDSTARMGSASDSAGIPRFSIGSVDRFVSGVGRPHEKVFDERIWDTVVQVDGGLASVWTKYAFYLGDQFNHCGVDVFELTRRPDGWKIVYLADTRRKEGCWTGPK